MSAFRPQKTNRSIMRTHRDRERRADRACRVRARARLVSTVGARARTHTPVFNFIEYEQALFSLSLSFSSANNRIQITFSQVGRRKTLVIHRTDCLSCVSLSLSADPGELVKKKKITVHYASTSAL